MPGLCSSMDRKSSVKMVGWQWAMNGCCQLGLLICCRVRRLDGKGSIGERDDWSSRGSEQEVDEVTRTEVRFAFYQYR